MRERHQSWRTRRHAEERVAEIWRELAVGEACSNAGSEDWRVTEEGLFDELTELELFLLVDNSAPPEALPGGSRGAWED